MCRINEVIYVLLLALHLAHCQGSATCVLRMGKCSLVPFPWVGGGEACLEGVSLALEGSRAACGRNTSNG